MNLSYKRESGSQTSRFSAIEQAEKLLEEKAKLLEGKGFWFRKSARMKHKEINQKLEALGVYQGKMDRIIID